MQKCFHCDLPTPDDTPFTSEIDGNVRMFCCPGCQAVAETISQAGLSNYYQYREQPAQRTDIDAEQLAVDQALFDSPSFNQEFVKRQDDGQYCADILVDGITCAACTWLLENAVGATSGVSSVKVNLQERRLRVNWDGESLALSQITSHLRKLGYNPHPYLPDQLREQQSRENKTFIKRLGVAGIGMMQVGMYAVALHAGAIEGISEEFQQLLRGISTLVAVPVLFYSAAPFFTGAWRGLKQGSAGMDLPVALALSIAFVFSLVATIKGTGDVYYDSIVMFTFLLLLGRYMEMRARHQLGDPAAALRALLPRIAHRLNDAGELESIALAELAIGDKILIKAGEVIGVDGHIVEGTSTVDESAFSGEHKPIKKHSGDPVSAGSINGESALQVVVNTQPNQSRLHHVFDLLSEAQLEKPKLAQLADTLAVYFVFFVLACSAGTALYWWNHAPDEALWIALSVLVVSCPCALSLATPTALTAAISRLKACGLLIAGKGTIQSLNRINYVIFDKTGTLTAGKLTIDSIVPVADIDPDECAIIAACLERHSEHPIAKAFSGFSASRITADVQQHTGRGIEGLVNGIRYRIGNPDFVSAKPPEGSGTWVGLCNDSQLLAWFSLSDQLRPSARACINSLQQLGMQVEILSGDQQTSVDDVAGELGINLAQGSMSPEDKLAYLKRLQMQGDRVLMVGDGINDIAVLAGADVSVAMGNASDLAKTNADAVLLSTQLTTLTDGILVARGCLRVIKQNIGWALFYNALAIPLAMMGYVPPYLAAIGMSLSSLIVVINALRLKQLKTP